ncbi:MAG: stage III sporulation protein AF [Eubacterium ventriosum]
MYFFTGNFLVLNIFPESGSKKYIKLFAGIVLLALIVNPIINIKNNSGDIEQIIKTTLMAV